MLPKKSQSQLAGNIYSVREEWLNAFTHGCGFILAVIGLIALINKSSNTQEIVVVTIYGLSLAMMFLSSSLYHSAKQASSKKILRKADHVAIYLLIAGSYTPFLLLAVGSKIAIIGLIIVWFIGVSGIIFKLMLGHKYPKLSISTYAAMGWLALFLIYPIYQSLSAAGFTLLLVGGLCYSAGIPLYLLKSRHYSHALWHLCVVAGATCHFFAVYLYVI